MQTDQKKVPVFRGGRGQGYLDHCGLVRPLARNEDIWSDEATFCNATATLFGNAQRVVDNWVILDKKLRQDLDP